MANFWPIEGAGFNSSQRYYSVPSLQYHPVPSLQYHCQSDDNPFVVMREPEAAHERTGFPHHQSHTKGYSTYRIDHPLGTSYGGRHSHVMVANNTEYPPHHTRSLVDTYPSPDHRCASQEDVASNQSSTNEYHTASAYSPYQPNSPHQQPLSSSCPSVTREQPPDDMESSSLRPDDKPPRPRAHSSSSQAHRRSKLNVKSASMKCTTCSKILKNSSEAQKHSLQHSKPYMCEDAKCRRHREGFATKNDLERHRKTVHSRVPLLGERGGYICAACLGSTKFWPRKDNFRAHCKRRHKDVDSETLLDRSKTDQNSTSPASNTSFVTSAPSLTDTTDDRSRQAEIASCSDSTAQQTVLDSQMSFEVLQFGDEDDLACVGAGPESTLPHIALRRCDDTSELDDVLDFHPGGMEVYGSPVNYSDATWDSYNDDRYQLM